jgi:hypothetical protein
VAVLAALALAGCASNTPIENFAGVPQVEVAAPHDDEVPDDQATADESAAEPELEDLDVTVGEPQAVYLNNGDRLAVVLWGSSTCPPVAERVVVTKDANSGNAVRVDVAEIPADQICTADLVPHTTVFGTPQQISTTQPLKIDIDGQEIVLPVK